jgi:hypothetical protein
MKKALFSTVFLLFMVSATFAADIRKSACRISTSQGTGSGLVIDIKDNTIWVFTCAHNVPNGYNAVNVEFFTTLELSKKIKGNVYKIRKGSSAGDDFCALWIRKSDLGDYPVPPPILVAPKSYKITSGGKIRYTGCSLGTWPTYTLSGHVLKNKGKMFTFKPIPHHGDSGSGIVNENDEMIGIVYAYTSDGKDCVGMAVSLGNIYEIMGWK